jgi:hypothetical protein
MKRNAVGDAGQLCSQHCNYSCVVTKMIVDVNDCVFFQNFCGEHRFGEVEILVDKTPQTWPRSRKSKSYGRKKIDGRANYRFT